MRHLVLPATVAPPDDGAAIRSAMGMRMSKFNWRSLDDTYYDHIEEAETTGIAWECLRRNATFQQDYQATTSPDRTMSAGFRQHWGLVFRS